MLNVCQAEIISCAVHFISDAHIECSITTNCHRSSTHQIKLAFDMMNSPISNVIGIGQASNDFPIHEKSTKNIHQ